MRTYEVAAVKMAVKRSIKAGTIEAGYKSIFKWSKLWPNANITLVLKCFRKWGKRYQNYGH